MVAGSVVSRLIEQFQDKQQLDRPEYIWHHDQQASVQISFMKYLQSLVGVINGFGNSFEEESQDLLVLDRKEIATLTALEALVELSRWVSYKRQTDGKNKPINEHIQRNKLKSFGQSN